MDCTWPLPFAVPKGKGPTWTSVACDTDEESTQKRVTEGLQRLCELRRRIADFFAAKDPSAQPQDAFINDVAKPYAHLLYCATLHLDCSQAGSGTAKKQKDRMTKVEFDDAWTRTARTSSSTAVEIALCLYNIAASLSIMGSHSVAEGTADSQKVAFQQFQEAAAYVKHIRTTLMPIVPTGDQLGVLLPESIEYTENLLLANAGHAFCLRAAGQENAKKSLLAKLCADVGKAYAALAEQNLHEGKSKSFANIQLFCKVAAGVCTGRAATYVAQTHFENEEAGKAIAQYQVALASVVSGIAGDAKKEPRPEVLSNWSRSEHERISALHSKALQRNETVYHDRIPASVPSIDGFGKVKAAPASIPAMPALTSEENPFAAVVPPRAADAAKRFKATMAKQLSARQQEVLENRAQVGDTLAQLGVAGVVATLTGDSEQQCKVPEGLRKKITDLRGGAGPEYEGTLVPRLVDLVSHIHQVGESIDAACEETTVELDAEAAEDKVLAEGFGQRVWRPLRKESCELPDVARLRKLVKELRDRRASELTTRLASAKASLEANAKSLSRLDWPLADLDALMPFRGSAQAEQSRADLREAAEKLAKLQIRIDQTVEVETARFKQIQAFINSSRVARALTAAGADREEEVLDGLQTEVIDHYSVIGSATDSRQQLVQEMEATMIDIASKRSEDPIAAEVQAVCTEIEKTIEQFASSTAGLTDIANNAGLLLEEAIVVRNSARAIRQARKLEGEEFAETLEREITQRVAAMQQGGGMSEQQLESRRRQDALQAEIDRLEAERTQRLANAASPAHPQPTPQVQLPPAGRAPAGATPVATAAPAAAAPSTHDIFAAPPAASVPVPTRAGMPQGDVFAGGQAVGYDWQPQHQQKRPPPAGTTAPPPPGPPPGGPPADEFDAFFQ